MPRRFFQRPTRPLVALAACVLTLVLSKEASSQATVTITRLADMSFGNVAAGTATPISYSDAGASAFRMDVTNMSGFQRVVLTFSLPTQIANGGDSIPISFGAADAAWSYTNDPALAISFDPTTGAQIPKDGNLFNIYVWIGATIDPDGSTPAQQYSNTLTLDAQIE